MTIEILKDGERVDQLHSSDVKIIQNKDVFSYSIDSVLLSRFPRIPKKNAKIVDMCAGNGAVGLFVSSKTKVPIYEIELQERLADMAQRSVNLNGLEEQVTVINDDLKNSLNYLKPSSIDLLLCNPPYFKVDPESNINDNKHYTMARHEITTNLDEILDISQKLLKTNGHLAMVHRPDRFFEICQKMIERNIIPKRIQFVYPKKNANANILLIDAIKDGRKGGEQILPPLIIHEEDGSYTKEVFQIYYGQE
ncbi:tRNA1(Val) (adenine(37)-N6)-methyltransferase [Streptococcaceae bacterium ESL0687]|nr:tRNA1(Val) (adenine(37)-N6)-methyltransferase [Streptococcaceae bacterium ESL0687]